MSDKPPAWRPPPLKRGLGVVSPARLRSLQVADFPFDKIGENERKMYSSASKIR
jgi:hypothetical protein